MWEFMMHESGRGLVRGDWDRNVFESYHGNGTWKEDPDGFGLWSGLSSDWMHYTEITEQQAAKVMEDIDAHLKKGAVSPNR
jgi:hypothetical protein